MTTPEASYLYNEKTHAMKVFTHDNCKIIKGVFFKGLLYTLCVFKIEYINEIRYDGQDFLNSVNYSCSKEEKSAEKWNFAYEDDEDNSVEMNMVFVWINGVSYKVFYGQNLRLIETENSLYVGDFLSDQELEIYNITDGVAQFVNMIEGTEIYVEDSCDNVHVFCDDVVYKIENDDFVKVKEISIPEKDFFYRNGVITISNSIQYMSRCGNYTIHHDTLENITTKKKRVLKGNWEIQNNFLCLLDGDKIIKETFENELLYLLPNAETQQACISDYLSSKYHDKNLEFVISSFLR